MACCDIPAAPGTASQSLPVRILADECPGPLSEGLMAFAIDFSSHIRG